MSRPVITAASMVDAAPESSMDGVTVGGASDVGKRKRQTGGGLNGMLSLLQPPSATTDPSAAASSDHSVLLPARAAYTHSGKVVHDAASLHLLALPSVEDAFGGGVLSRASSSASVYSLGSSSTGSGFGSTNASALNSTSSTPNSQTRHNGDDGAAGAALLAAVGSGMGGSVDSPLGRIFKRVCMSTPVMLAQPLRERLAAIHTQSSDADLYNSTPPSARSSGMHVSGAARMDMPEVLQQPQSAQLHSLHPPPNHQSRPRSHSSAVDNNTFAHHATSHEPVSANSMRTFVRAKRNGAPAHLYPSPGPSPLSDFPPRRDSSSSSTSTPSSFNFFSSSAPNTAMHSPQTHPPMTSSQLHQMQLPPQAASADSQALFSTAAPAPALATTFAQTMPDFNPAPSPLSASHRSHASHAHTASHRRPVIVSPASRQREKGWVNYGDMADAAPTLTPDDEAISVAAAASHKRHMVTGTPQGLEPRSMFFRESDDNKHKRLKDATPFQQQPQSQPQPLSTHPNLTFDVDHPPARSLDLPPSVSSASPSPSSVTSSTSSRPSESTTSPLAWSGTALMPPTPTEVVPTLSDTPREAMHTNSPAMLDHAPNSTSTTSAHLPHKSRVDSTTNNASRARRAALSRALDALSQTLDGVSLANDRVSSTMPFTGPSRVAALPMSPVLLDTPRQRDVFPISPQLVHRGSKSTHRRLRSSGTLTRSLLTLDHSTSSSMHTQSDTEVDICSRYRDPNVSRASPPSGGPLDDGCPLDLVNRKRRDPNQMSLESVAPDTDDDDDPYDSDEEEAPPPPAPHHVSLSPALLVALPPPLFPPSPVSSPTGELPSTGLFTSFVKYSHARAAAFSASGTPTPTIHANETADGGDMQSDDQQTTRTNETADALTDSTTPMWPTQP